MVYQYVGAAMFNNSEILVKSLDHVLSSHVRALFIELQDEKGKKQPQLHDASTSNSDDGSQFQQIPLGSSAQFATPLPSQQNMLMQQTHSRPNVGPVGMVTPPFNTLSTGKLEVSSFVFLVLTTSSSIISLVQYVSNSRAAEISASMPLVPYNTVAYSSPPIPPQGTGIPYGPLPNTYFNVPLQNSPHMQHVTSHS